MVEQGLKEGLAGLGIRPILVGYLSDTTANSFGANSRAIAMACVLMVLLIASDYYRETDTALTSLRTVEENPESYSKVKSEATLYSMGYRL